MRDSKILTLNEVIPLCFLFFFFNDTATTEIYTLSLHDVLPICLQTSLPPPRWSPSCCSCSRPDRKSTRLNSSHSSISYAVFCLKKKKNKLIYFSFEKKTKKKNKKKKINKL